MICLVLDHLTSEWELFLKWLDLMAEPKGLKYPQCLKYKLPAHLMRKCCSRNDTSLKFDFAHKRCN